MGLVHLGPRRSVRGRLRLAALLSLAAASVAAPGGVPAASAGPRESVTSLYELPAATRAVFEEPAAGPAEVLALANPYVLPPEVEVRISGGKTDEKKPARSPRPRRGRRGPSLALTPERAQALLRSLTVPGWGQATLGSRTAGAVFGVIESGVWGSFMAFRIQERLRREASGRTARIFAGVDLKGRDEEFLRLVGAFASSDEYNLLVVVRDAANLHYDDPESYRDYIARHSLSGADRWSWQDENSFLRYRAQRKDAQRAGLRANTSLALAVANRIVSVLHAARTAGRRSAASADPPRSWNFEVSPAGGDDPTAYRFGLSTRF